MAKLDYINNWEADEYSVGGKRVTELKLVRINGKEYRVTKHRLSIPYNDMGHIYHGVSDHFFVREKVFGIDKMFDLNEVISHKVVYALEYKTE